MILVSSLGRAFWTAWNADSMSGEAVSVPTVRLAYSSAKKRRHILDTYVIFARDHGSGKVERLCNSSDVSSPGDTIGRSLSFGRYLSVSFFRPTP